MKKIFFFFYLFLLNTSYTDDDSKIDFSVSSLSEDHSIFEHNQLFHSQASQDEFVYTMLYGLLNKKDGGYYLEIGAGDPVFTNNSYFFEKKFEWDGISIDISDSHQSLWREARKNNLLIADATQCDFRSILKEAPFMIDYLSLDVDCDYDTVLKLLPFDEHIFKVITIEHDSYLCGDVYKNKEREILKSLGYYLLCSDVLIDWTHNSRIQPCSFEDWWIHPSILSQSLLNRLKDLDLMRKNHAQLVQTLQSLQ